MYQRILQRINHSPYSIPKSGGTEENGNKIYSQLLIQVQIPNQNVRLVIILHFLATDDFI